MMYSEKYIKAQDIATRNYNEWKEEEKNREKVFAQLVALEDEIKAIEDKLHRSSGERYVNLFEDLEAAKEEFEDLKEEFGDY